MNRIIAKHVLIVFTLVQTGCNGGNAQYENVFRPLDGKWEGTFRVYESTADNPGLPRPTDISTEQLGNMAKRLMEEITVTQRYYSIDSLTQSVIISDTYTLENGTKETINSTGVNKVEKGKLVCIVEKPDERVVHSGTTDGDNVIIWQREERNPNKVEYFRETVTWDKYTIVGWGYYGEDDLAVGPKTWFLGEYRRVR